MAARRHLALVALFCLALAAAITMALIPHPPPVFDFLNDKCQHILAFATLTLLARLAWPAAPALRIAEHLSFLGALIEVTQALPSVHRDCDIRDWLADTAAILIVLAFAQGVRRLRN